MARRKKEDKRTPVDFVISTLNRGGAENKLVAVANGIDKTKYAVRVLVLKNGPLVSELDVTFVKNILTNKYDFLGFINLFILFRSNNTKIVWVVGNGDSGFFGRIAAKLAGVSVVIQSLHATKRLGGKPTIDTANKFLDRLGVFTTKYIAVARSHMEYMINNQGIKSSKIGYIYNGVDTDIFRPANADLELLDQLGIPVGSKVVGIVGRFKAIKRHNLFIDAANLVHKSDRDIHFLLVGDGPLESNIRSQVEALDLSDRVHFTGGVNVVAPYYRLMTVTVLCSEAEAFPNVILESMASGTPVVTTNVGSISEVVIDGVNGIIVSDDNKYSISEGIIKCLNDTQFYNKLQISAIETIDGKFTLDYMINAREDLFCHLLTYNKGVNNADGK